MKTTAIDKELDAIKTIIHALESLDESQTIFVLRTVTDRLGITLVPKVR